MQAKGGYGRLSPLPRRVSLASRIDRLTRLMKEGQAPSQHSPHGGRGKPPPPNHLPWGKGTVPSSLSPNPYLSPWGGTWYLWYIGWARFVIQHEVFQLNSC